MASSTAGTSGYLSIGSPTSHQFLFSWYVADRSIQSDGSVNKIITWELRCISLNEDGSTKANSIRINGTNYGVYPSYYSSTAVSLTTEAVLATGTTTANWDADKMGHFGVSVEIILDDSTVFSGSDTFAVTDFDDGAFISLPVTIIGNKATINFLGGTTDYTYDITYEFGDLTGTIIEGITNTTYYEWTIPETFYNQIPNSIFGSGFITIGSRPNGASSSVWTHRTEFFVRVNSEKCRPKITPNIYDSNTKTVALTGNDSTLVRYQSTANYNIGATAQYGATITSQALSNNNSYYSDASGAISNVVDNVFAFAATDSRGLRTMTTVTPTMVDYVNLTVIPEISNPTSSGTVDISVRGAYFKGSFGKSSNTLTVQYRYKAKDGSYGSWKTLTASASDGVYSASTTITGLDYQTTYILQVQATDKLQTVTSADLTLKAQPVFDWSKEDFNFNVPVTAKSGLSVTGDLLVNNQNVGDAIAQIGNSVSTGTWEPTISCCNSMDSSDGHYVRIGDLCILTWYASGTVSDTSTRVSISNLPFWPDASTQSQGGGGTLDGGHCETNNSSFCGWSLEDPSGMSLYGIYACAGPLRSNSSTGGTSVKGYMLGTKSSTLTVSGMIMYKVAEGE